MPSKNTICTTLNDQLLAALDDLRGPLDRSTYLRWLLVQAQRTDQRFTSENQ